MRFAILADIHGNADALRAVLADLGEASPDLVVNLGDSFSGPLAARETGEILRERNWPTMRGNHDRYLVEPAPDRMGRSDRTAFNGLVTRRNGQLRFENRFVPYDTTAMAALAIGWHRPDGAHALVTGFVER